jgi:DNA helicase II / ATP-dependent DNA helicase PcrA
VTDFLKDLNTVQQEAVKDIYGASLIIAGAGSGKTRVLTYRIAYLLSQDIAARSILALTFTNKAAGEMKKRITELVGYGNAKYLWMGTFHSVFSRILRTESAHLGYTQNFTIYDTEDSKNLIKSIIKELSLNDETYKPADVLARISHAKNNLVTAEAYAANPKILQGDNLSRKPMISDIYRRYHKKCREADAMDFDDLLLNMNILFRDFPAILDKYKKHFKFILVDEYQDTNYSQYLIVKRLAEEHKNVCVVGDDAQSIYSFRGARIENILNFRNDYPDYKLYKLEQNYRSTKNIVDAANSLIEKNQNQIQKKIWSDNAKGDKIKVYANNSDIEEGMVVASAIFDIHKEGQDQYSDFAILYRTNAQSRIFEDALRRRNIPYRIYGSVSFYQRKEIKDLLAYIKLIVNPKDTEAFSRVINYPARGIGKTTTDKIAALSLAEGIHIWDIVSNLGQYAGRIGLNRGTQEKIAGFFNLITEFREREQELNAYELALQVATRSGILKDLFDPNSKENIQKYENIQELLNGVKEFVDQANEEGETASLANFLQNIALLTDADNEKDEDHNKVKLMTIHSAKGLEFNYVFIAGVEEELFPGRYSTLTQQDLEEERRLFYVALTRAKKRASISYAKNRMRWGNMVFSNPSRFVAEIQEEFLEYYENPYASEPPKDKSAGKFQYNNARDSGYNSQSSPQKKLLKMKAAVSSPAENSVSHTQSEIQPGMTVYHEKFGKGKVLQVEGDISDLKGYSFFPGSRSETIVTEICQTENNQGLNNPQLHKQLPNTKIAE